MLNNNTLQSRHTWAVQAACYTTLHCDGVTSVNAASAVVIVIDSFTGRCAALKTDWASGLPVKHLASSPPSFLLSAFHHRHSITVTHAASVTSSPHRSLSLLPFRSAQVLAHVGMSASVN